MKSQSLTNIRKPHITNDTSYYFHDYFLICTVRDIQNGVYLVPAWFYLFTYHIEQHIRNQIFNFRRRSLECVQVNRH